MSSAELKPCPFCGGAALYGVVGHDSGDADHPDFGGSYIQCEDCKASTCLMFPLKQDVDQALAEKWNARVCATLCSSTIAVLAAREGERE